MSCDSFTGCHSTNGLINMADLHTTLTKILVARLVNKNIWVLWLVDTSAPAIKVPEKRAGPLPFAHQMKQRIIIAQRKFCTNTLRGHHRAAIQNFGHRVLGNALNLLQHPQNRSLHWLGGVLVYDMGAFAAAAFNQVLGCQFVDRSLDGNARHIKAICQLLFAGQLFSQVKGSVDNIAFNQAV